MPRANRRGFTLVEMLVVVVLVGVLATLAVFGVRKYILAAKSSEAVSMMTSIKASEEAFKGETFTYLDVSGSFATGNYYPTITPTGNKKTQWGGTPAGVSATVAQNFRTLGVAPDAPVMFGYAVVACGPGGACTDFPTLPTSKTNAQFNLPSAANRWGYVAVARCDVNNDGSTGKQTIVVSHSYSNEVYVENEGE